MSQSRRARRRIDPVPRTTSLPSVLLRCLVAAAALALLPASSAQAWTFIVNSTDDGFDNNPGDGDCWTGGWVR